MGSRVTPRLRRRATSTSAGRRYIAPTPTGVTHRLGMRGGLGKTLLITFLLLTIVPLGLLAFLTYNQIQRDTGQKLVASLENMVVLKEAHLIDWLRGYERELNWLAGALDAAAATGVPAGEASGSQPESYSAPLAALQAIDPTFDALVLLDLDSGQVLASTDPAWADAQVLQPLVVEEVDSDTGVLTGVQRTRTGSAGSYALVVAPPADTPPAESAGRLSGEGDSWGEPVLAVNYAWEDASRSAHERRLLIGVLSWDSLQQLLSNAGVVLYLVTRDGWILSSDGLTTSEGALARDHPARTVVESSSPRPYDGADPARIPFGRSSQAGTYTGLAGSPVFGAYRWNPELQLGVVAEQSQQQALSTGNTVTAVVVGTTLAVALVTSILAAVITRRVTRPIVQLTESAAWMARGDLNHRVPIERGDEIGVLSQAFNRMAAELGVLYENLEARVTERTRQLAERTQQLEAANEDIRGYLMQLATSAEVARIAVSIRDPDELLTTVVGLISRAFELDDASVYLLDEARGYAGEARGYAGEARGDTRPVSPLVDLVAADGCRRVARAGTPGVPAGTVCELAVPLRIQQRVLGVLDLQSSRPDAFGEDEQVLFQSLADQIGIAIENARVYAVERQTVIRLRELDRIQSEFLTNMSHALRTPLNSIIGFSRVLLKELDGPLTETQRADLSDIHDSGRQLLGLINDMLELSQLQLGVAPLTRSEVDLAEIIEGVMATTRALACGKPVRLYQEVPNDLPLLYTDGQRVRQVVLTLLSNAVKFTARGSIHLRVSAEDGHVTISVQDTRTDNVRRMGLPCEEREQIFSNLTSECAGEAGIPTGSGLELAISKQVVEKLGGQIWMESEEGIGSTLTFTLPVRPTTTDTPDAGGGVGDAI